MNVIVVVSDTFRRDHLGCYGNRSIHTEHLDRLAAKSLVFDRAYVASFPTIPNRADCFTGKFTFPFYSWGPLRPGETVLSDVLTKAGYVTQLICDTPHLISGGNNYQRGFRGWQWIRGQEGDLFRTGANLQAELPCAPEKLRGNGRALLQHMRNNYYRKKEEDWIPAQSVKAAMQWLDENWKAEKWFLWLDMFDPHEPWDPPEHLLELYLKGYKGVRVPHAKYARVSEFTPDEVKWIRAAYAGEVTLVDRWIGKLLAKVSEMGLWDDTALIFTTDHGYYFGEHDAVGKLGWDAPPWALYEEITHIPLIVRAPVAKGPGRTGAIVQPPDLTPTILDLCGVEHWPGMHGRSLYPLITGEAKTHREFAFSSSPLTETRQALVAKKTVTSEGWTLIFHGEDASELYDVEKDPRQENNVIAGNEDVARRLHGAFVSFLEQVGAAPEVVEREQGCLHLPGD